MNETLKHEIIQDLQQLIKPLIREENECSYDLKLRHESGSMPIDLRFVDKFRNQDYQINNYAIEVMFTTKPYPSNNQNMNCYEKKEPQFTIFKYAININHYLSKYKQGAEVNNILQNKHFKYKYKETEIMIKVIANKIKHYVRCVHEDYSKAQVNRANFKHK